MIYSSIAPYYDALMCHVDYREWLQLIQKIVKKHYKSNTISIFEIGAGTGNLGKLLFNAGYNYLGSDFSFEMNKILKTKANQSFCADARYLPINKKFDMILFLYDGINYLPSLNDYKKLFFSVSDLLPQNGLFLFDITTETNSKKYFFDYLYFDEFNKTSLIRHSYYSPHEHIQANDFVLFIPKGDNHTYIKKTEHHQQKLFSPDQILRTIPKKLFSCLGIYDGFSFTKYSSHSERIHFLLKKI